MRLRDVDRAGPARPDSLMAGDPPRDGEVEMETTAQAADRRSDELGRRGEDLAADYLVGTGLVLLSRNWRCRDGEVDLVTTDGELLVVLLHR
jgi:Uncharacterised protein family UPF0102